MKIAFVGKGGSGKSTTTSLFIKYLLEQNQTVLAIDADINMHVSGLLGIDRNLDLALSENSNVLKIRSILKGENTYIRDVSHFVKTTPPGVGSHLIRLKEDNEILKNFATKFSKHGFYLFVGTYESDEIGTACYHTNLSIFENILSHTILGKNEWIVADMVAGTDAFSNTLHAQFDAIILVVEPTPEGVSVFEQYLKLSEDAGIVDNLFLLGNKLEDESDLKYLKDKIGNKLLGGFTLKKTIKQARQNNVPLNLDILDKKETALLQKVVELIEKKGEDSARKLQLLHSLHKKYVAQDYIVKAHGDITDQIDTSFQYPQK